MGTESPNPLFLLSAAFALPISPVLCRCVKADVLASDGESNEPFHNYSNLPSGMITLVGVLGLAFSSWLQGGLDVAPLVVRATRYMMPYTALSGQKIDVRLDPHNSTGFTLFSFSPQHLANFILDTAQRGLFHVGCYTLSGHKSVQQFSYDRVTDERFRCLGMACRLPGSCNNKGTRRPNSPWTVPCDTLTPNKTSELAIERETRTPSSPNLDGTFLIHGCIFPLHSLVHLPVRFWVERGVISKEEGTELNELHITSPLDCFFVLRQWFSGVDIWDWIKTSVESSDASYMLSVALLGKYPFVLETEDNIIDWPPLGGTTCNTCSELAMEEGALASLAAVRIAVWFFQFAFYHEALYKHGVVMIGYKNSAAATLFMEVANNRAGRNRYHKNLVFSNLSRKGAFLERVKYQRGLEHASGIGEAIVALVLCMVADPGVFVAATLARQTGARVLCSDSGRGLPMGQRWHWSCVGRLTPLGNHKSQGVAVWGFDAWNPWVATLYGWLVVIAALAGTRLRGEAARLQWCTNFGILRWVGWVNYGALCLVSFTSLLLSLLGPARCQDLRAQDTSAHDFQAKAGPIAAEASLKAFTSWRIVRLTTILASVVVGALALTFPHAYMITYTLEALSLVLWIATEEYTLKDRYDGSAVAIALLTSGLAGISRGMHTSIPSGCLALGY